MPLNVPGFLAVFQVCVKPTLIVPHISVKDIRQLDFAALKHAGYRAAIFDKDNCLTLPHHDELISQLKETWIDCVQTFGSENVLIVSNSAGSKSDGGDIKAESVGYHLGVPVLRHDSLKPSYSCIKRIRGYFASLPVPVKESELIVVGDRIFTDVLMANRMSSSGSIFIKPETQKIQTLDAQKEGEVIRDGYEKSSKSFNNHVALKGPLAILTTSVWQRESMILRAAENALVRIVERLMLRPDYVRDVRSSFDAFIRDSSNVEDQRTGIFKRFWGKLRGS